MKDQFGSDVPNDLVVLDNPGDNQQLVEAALDANCTWYLANDRVILVSFAEYPFSETDPEDAGVHLESADIYQIAHCLKRYNEVDGFYHA